MRDLAVTDAGARAMAWLVEQILNGTVPDGAQRWLRSGTQLALIKDDAGGIRPAVMGCGLRRLGARTVVRSLREALRRKVGARGDAVRRRAQPGPKLRWAKSSWV